MPATATMVGDLLGLLARRCTPTPSGSSFYYIGHPWEHVLGMGLGAIFVNQLVKWGREAQGGPRQDAGQGQGRQ
ncbi:unnamed protein product [Musa banksii]